MEKKREEKTEHKHIYDNLNVTLKQMDIFIGIMIFLLVVVLVIGIARA